MASRKPALIFIFITLFLDILGIGLIAPIVPKLVKEMTGGGDELASYYYGWLVGLYALMQFLFAPFIGSLSDRFGRRPVILLALLGSGLDYILLAYAQTIPWFFFGRIVSGISGASFSAAAAYIADVSPPERRSANFGIIGVAFGLGFIFGPAIGGWLGHYGLRVPFIAAAVLTLANWLYGLLILPESLKPENRRALSLRRSNPIGALLDLRRHKLVLGLSFTYFLSSFAHQVYPSIWVLYTGHRYGWDTKQTGLSLALVGLTAALVQGGLNRRLIPILGERRSALIGLGIMAIALTGYGFATKGWMVYGLIIFGSLSGLAVPAIQGMISRTVGDDEQGGIQGSLTSLQSVAGGLAPPLITYIFGYFISAKAPALVPGAPFFFASGVVVMAAFLAARSFRKNPIETEHASEHPERDLSSPVDQ